MKNYSLYIFDFDGTLADSGLGIAYSIQAFSKQKGLPIYTERQILDAVGHGVDELLDKLYPTNNFNDEQRYDFIEEFIEVYRQNQKQKTFLYSGAEELLRNLVKNNKKIAIVSNKPEDLLIDVVKSLGLDELPWIKIAGAETFSEPKPSAVPLEEVMKLANESPENTVMVGDSDADYLAAVNAKSDFLGCSFGIGSQYLATHYPEIKIIHSITEVAPKL
jgi:phosphoglycolate phosphatase